MSISSYQDTYYRPPAYNPERRPVHTPTAVDLEEDCSICQGAFKEKPEGDPNDAVVLSKTQCHHFFHEFCLDDWLKKSANQDCPLCRASVYPAQVTTIPVEMKPVQLPKHPVVATVPAPYAPSIPAPSVFFRVANTMSSIWSAINADSADTIKARKAEVETRIVLLQGKLNKLPSSLKKQREELEVALVSLRSLMDAHSKEALTGVKTLEKHLTQFEISIETAQQNLLNDLINFQKLIQAAIAI